MIYVAEQSKPPQLPGGINKALPLPLQKVYCRFNMLEVGLLWKGC